MKLRSSATSTKASSNINAWIFSLGAWIFALEYSLYLVGDVYIDILIKISAFLCMVVLFRYRRSTIIKQELILLILYYSLFLSALVPSLLMGDLIGVAQWIKLVFMSTIFPILILSSSRLKKNEGLLISIYIVVAVVFSIQAIAAWILVYLGLIDITTVVDIGRRPDVPEISLGMLGFGNAIQNPLVGTSILRPQGWFLEPSLLASFLLLPLFVYVGRYLQFRRRNCLLWAVIIFAALVSTLSLAGYISVIAAAVFFFFSKSLYNSLRDFNFLKFSYPILLFGILIIGASTLLSIGHLANEVVTDDITENQFVLAQLFKREPEGPSGNLFRERDNIEAYISTIASNPFGIGFRDTLGTSEILSVNAFVFWAIAGGILAVMLIPVLFIYIFWAFCHPLLISDDYISRALAASLIGHVIHNLSYGNWAAPYFLIHLAIVVILIKNYEIRG